MRTNIPPRRAPATPTKTNWSESIDIPLARDRLYDYFNREPVPNDVKTAMSSAVNGELHHQHMVFTAMMDSWPKLQKSINEISKKVSVANWQVVPFAKRGENPTPEAEKMAKEVEALVWGMKPKVERMELGLEDTIRFLVRGYFYGHAVQKITWDQNNNGEWFPRCTKSLPARYFGYPNGFEIKEDQEDRLMFDRTGQTGARVYEDFPAHKFLIAINCGHSAHPSVSAPLRALVSYWLAAIYGLKWAMNYTQLYGIPWRHAEVSDPKDDASVRSALTTIGSTGHIITRPGTKINVLSPGTRSSGGTPQDALIALADQQCEQFILGQTLTSGTGDTGSRALGEVHQNTLDDVIAGVSDFISNILSDQLIPSIVAANWGADYTDLPTIRVVANEVDDSKLNAERMDIIIKMGIPMTEAYVYEALGVPIPAAGDTLFEAPTPPPAPVMPGNDIGKPPVKPPTKPPAAVAAGLAEDAYATMVDDLGTGKTLDWQALAVLMAAGFVEGAKTAND